MTCFFLTVFGTCISSLMKTQRVDAVVSVDIVSPGFIVPTSNAALSFSGPAYEEAVNDCNRIYAGVLNFTLNFVTVDGKDIKDARVMTDMSFDLAANWYYRKRKRRNGAGVVVIISPGGQDTSYTHQLSAEWNVLYFTTVGYKKSSYTLAGPPPLVTAVISVGTMAMTFLNVIDMYNWTTVFAIIDYSSPPVFYSVADDIDVNLLNRSERLTYYKRNLYSAQLALTGYADLLAEFKTISRVLIFLGRSEQLRLLMIEAAWQNLTNGEFVYICAEPYRFEKNYGNYSWQYGDIYDETAREAFGSLLTIHPVNSGNNASVMRKAMAFGSRIQANAKKLFNTSFTSRDLPIWDTLAGYSSVRLYCQVMNESLHANGDLFLKDGRQLASQFLNTSYHDEFSDIHIDANGIRRTTLVVSHLIEDERNREAFLIQPELSDFELQVIPEIYMPDTWPGGIWPPLNEPFCGYKHELSRCQAHPYAITSQPVFIALVALAACAVSVTVLVLWIRWYFGMGVAYDAWWSIPADFLNTNRKPSFAFRNLAELTSAAEAALKRPSVMVVVEKGVK